LKSAVLEGLGGAASINKILVVALCGVGDLLFFLPTLKAMRREFKDARVDLLVLPNGSKALFSGRGLVDEVYEFPRQKWAAGRGGLRGQVELLKAVGKVRKRGYDICIWPYGATTIKKQVLTTLMGARLNIMHKGERFMGDRAVASKNRLVDYLPLSHGVERNFELLKEFGIRLTEEEKELIFPLSAEEVAFGDSYLRPFKERRLVGFHPGGNVAYNNQRQWEPAKYAGLADKISDKIGSHSFFFGSESEREMLEDVTRNMKSSVTLVTEFTLDKVASVINGLDIFVGNNSALIHQASSLGVKTVAINGPTDYHHTGPWGRDTHLVRLDIPCSPCYNYNAGQRKECDDNICLKQLSVEDVFKVLDDILKETKHQNEFMPLVYDIPCTAGLTKSAL